MKHQTIVVLGSTGSIGQSTLDVVGRHPELFTVYALSAYSRIQKLIEQALAHRPRVVIVPTEQQHQTFLSLWPASVPCPEIRIGSSALEHTVAEPDVTTVMAAIV